MLLTRIYKHKITNLSLEEILIKRLSVTSIKFTLSSNDFYLLILKINSKVIVLNQNIQFLLFCQKDFSESSPTDGLDNVEIFDGRSPVRNRSRFFDERIEIGRRIQTRFGLG